MKPWLVTVGALATALILTGCGGKKDGQPDAAPNSASATAEKATVPKPAANADESTWGVYLADQARVHAGDIGMKPLIYVVPAGDSEMADARRKNESESIVNGAGSIFISGSLLVVGGPDSAATLSFVEGLGTSVKPDTLKGVTLLVVSDGSQKETLSRKLVTTGARVRVVSM